MNKRSTGFCLSLFLLAGILFTWPLTGHFFSAIPYTLRPLPGFEQVPLMPGDHLQTYYWFWLLSDNLWGHSALFTNPYEFNGPIGPMSNVYANFPFSLLYLVLLPLGSVGAYNGLILLSFVSSGLAMFLLARSWTGDTWSSLMAGLVFAAVPYRVSHVAGGQLFGYVIFLLPLCLYFIEVCLRSRQWRFGWAAGTCLVLMSIMEPHTSFLTALTLGVYLPSRILLIRNRALVLPDEEKSVWPGLAGVFLAGLSLTVFLWIKFGVASGLPFWHLRMVRNGILSGLFLMLVWLFLSALFARVTTLSFSEARLKIGKGFLLLLPLAFYGLKLKWAIPHLGLILPFLSLTALAVCLIVIYFQNRDRLAGFDWVSIKGLVLGVGTGLALATAYLMHVRRTVFLPSLAGKGRVISEVLLFSPRMENLFFWQDINQERFVLLGWGLTILAVIGLLPLFKKRSGNQGYLAMAALMAFMALVLTLGPTLTDFPVYEILYRYFPFFNYPRVPGRFVMVGFIFLSLLAASALASLRSWLSKRGWPRLSLSMTGMIIILMVSEYHTWQPVGLSLMSKENRIYETVRQQMPQGKVLLELPIWPGDSHQSAAYEYAVTLTAKPMVNGYAPVVIRDYIQKVFWPLYPMDQGEFGETQEKELDRIGVDFITFHDNPQIFTEKVSPFPPRLALKRLLSSPSLKLVNQDQDIFLFRKDGSFSEEGPDRGSDITSPVKAVYYVNSLPHETGNYQFERAASGFNLLMEEKGLSQGQFFPKAGARGNVVSAVPGKNPPGFLTLGTHRFFPSGKYKALFRMKSGTVGTQVPIGRIEILQGKTSVIAQRTLFNRDFMNDGDWSDIPLEFQILQAGDVGFRVYYSGQAPLSLNIILIGFMDQGNGAGSVEAEDLLRQTGTVVSDPSASGKEAVLAHAGFHPPIYICYGPYRTLKPGKYRAKFFMRLKDSNRISPETELALLEMATDMGKRIFSQRKIKAQDLQADAYRSVDIDFEVPFRCELGYRVKFTGKADLLVDRISVESR